MEDVVWKPNSAAELASVGDDRGLLLWDTRSGTAPALRKTDAHGTHDLHTVDWSGLREELLATGMRGSGRPMCAPGKRTLLSRSALQALKARLLLSVL